MHTSIIKLLIFVGLFITLLPAKSYAQIKIDPDRYESMRKSGALRGPAAPSTDLPYETGYQFTGLYKCMDGSGVSRLCFPVYQNTLTGNLTVDVQGCNIAQESARAVLGRTKGAQLKNYEKVPSGFQTCGSPIGFNGLAQKQKPELRVQQLAGPCTNPANCGQPFAINNRHAPVTSKFFTLQRDH